MGRALFLRKQAVFLNNITTTEKVTSRTLSSFKWNATHDLMHDLEINHRGFLGGIHQLLVQKKSGQQREAKENKAWKMLYFAYCVTLTARKIKCVTEWPNSGWLWAIQLEADAVFT